MHSKKEVVFIEDPVLKFPKINTTYTLKTKSSTSCDISFEGHVIKKISSIDLSSGYYSTKKYEHFINVKLQFLIPKMSLPVYFMDKNLPPIMVAHDIYPGCYMFKAPFYPESINWESMKKKDALLWFDDQFFFADNRKKLITKIECNQENEASLEILLDSMTHQYKEADAKQLKLIRKMQNIFYPEHVTLVSRIKFSIDNGVKTSYRLHYFEELEHPVIDNYRLQNECQNLIKNVPVICGEYPIFYNRYRPHFHFLNELYQNFIRFNDNKKIQYQNKISFLKCHLRAHVVTLFFQMYGIETIKLYKFWKSEDWELFDESEKYQFHCASMVIDNNDNKWVLDIWEDTFPYLQTLNQWVHAKNLPAPRKLMIANKLIITDLSGYILTGLNCHKLLVSVDLNTMQGLIMSVFPLIPEKPLCHIATLIKSEIIEKNTILRQGALLSQSKMTLFSQIYKKEISQLKTEACPFVRSIK